MGNSQDLIDLYLEGLRLDGRSDRTIVARRGILRRVDDELAPAGLAGSTAVELRQWLARERWSAQTRGTYYSAISSFFAWATDPADPYLDLNPVQFMKRPRVPRGLPRPVTDRQLDRILLDPAQPFRLWALLAAYQGLRCVEISRLHREHVDERHVMVHRGKGDKGRAVPTHPDVWAALAPLPSGPLAFTVSGAPATAQYISTKAGQHYRDIGLAGVTLHRLRHWFGTTAHRATGNLRVTQQLLGHASPATTAIYTLVSDEEAAAAVAALPRLSPAGGDDEDAAAAAA